ncbi:Holliday junction branch migration protein RuvA [Vampirovibrio sp.]|uniref:Holliday junction branch migration protein RuvA n=1 Tax=Vampirovibrio sp. TaxID=2717857 RepID=UPI0035944792
MLSFLKGLLVSKAYESPKGAYFLVDMHGMGFEVLTSHRAIESSPMPGEQIQLFTALIVREDALFLVGFNTKEERDLFNILQSASGIGTKVALSLLSALSVSEIAQAVVSNNFNLLTKAKGVGNKLAQKMTLELKEKMMSWRSADFVSGLESSGLLNPSEAFLEAESVLLSLGYQPEEIQRSFKAIEGDVEKDASEIVLRESLRWLAQSV